MSAWIVDRAHIDVLVQGLAESETVTDVDPDELGRRLWAENLASVAYCYPSDRDGDRPGPYDFRDADVEEYTYRRPTAKIDRVGLLVALDCYRYQSCEHPGWKTSQAARWVETLLAALHRAGVVAPEPGQRMEAWGYEEADVHGAPAGVAR
jgi:hypothetical protein